MKKLNTLILLVILTLFTSCKKQVPAGNVGIKFYLLGQKKGVSHEELAPGRYYIGINEELYLFPTFTQNIEWTADKYPERGDQSFNFQDKEGLEVNADVGATYYIDPEKVDIVFQKYKKGVDEITNVFLKNMVRDALVDQSSVLDIEYIYGEGRSPFMDSVTVAVQNECEPIGIIVEKLYWIGRIKLPPKVKTAIDAKIEATQKAQEVENQLRESIAEANKKIATARGDSASVLIAAQGQAEANRVINASITKNLIEYNKWNTWNGVLPQVTGSSGVLLNMDK
jgi:regulator of protease activity HflC (stomatin/prohibitin superfamily)